MTQLPKPPGSPPATSPTTGKLTPPPPPPRPPTSNPFGSRLGGRADYPILSTGEIVARFELGTISTTLWNPMLQEFLPADAAIAAFESNKDLSERVKTILDQKWAGYGFRGAALVYLWKDELRNAVNNRLQALKRPTVYLHVTDPALILNILGRSRASLLLTDAPLALERFFLNRILATDDARLIQLARNLGSREEPLFEPLPPDEFDDLDDDTKR